MIPILCFHYFVSFTYIDDMFETRGFKCTALELPRRVKAKIDLIIITEKLRQDFGYDCMLMSICYLDQTEVSEEQAVELWGKDWKSRL